MSDIITNDPNANPIEADDNPLVAGLVAEFEARQQQSAANADPSGTDVAETPVEPAQEVAPPAPAPGDGEEEAQGDAAPEPIRVLPDPPAQSTINVAGQDIPVEHVQQALGTVQYLSQLPPEQLQAISDLVAGTHVLVPRDQPSAASGSGMGSPTPGSTVPPVSGSQTPAAPTLNPEDYVDPALARALLAQQAQFDARLADLDARYREQVGNLAATQATQHRERMAADVQAARDQFRAQYNFGEPELADIEARAVQMQLVPTFIQQGMSTTDAARQAMETALWSDQRYREALLQHQLTADQTQRDELATRRGKAASLSGGGTVARVSATVDPRAMTSEQRLAAIADEIANHQKNAV